jgi:RNA polymerase sigma-70 factor (ECF subfamily)
MTENSIYNKIEELSDVELMQLSLKKKDCFYYLIKRYEQKITLYIKRLTIINKEDLEDLLQDIFIKVYCNLNGFNQDLKFSTWIYRIAHNEVINYFRKNKAGLKMAPSNFNPKDICHLSELIIDTNNPHEDFISQEKADKIGKVLAMLPNKYREVLVLFYFEENKYEEISDILRKSPGTVATMINRAKSKFLQIAKEINLEVKHG